MRRRYPPSSSFFKVHGRKVIWAGFFIQTLLLLFFINKHTSMTKKSSSSHSVEVKHPVLNELRPPSQILRASINQSRDCNCTCLDDYVTQQVLNILDSGQFSEHLPTGQLWYVDKDVRGDSSIPGVEDVYAQLKAYLLDMLRSMETNMTVVRAAQHRSTAAQMGVEPWDDMEDTVSIPYRIKMVNRLVAQNKKIINTKICVYTTSKADLTGVRREILPWIQYHTELGIAHFYILYDGTDPKAVEAMTSMDHVTLIHIHPPFATKEKEAKYVTWRTMHKQWGGRPGNFELMVKQGFGTQEALIQSKVDGMDWLMHIDPDELFYPNNPSFSLVAEFETQPSYVSSLRFMNFEGQPEIGDIKNRYEQVTLFRAHKHFITPEAYALRNKCKLGDNRSFLVLYANGKSAVRVDANGAHQLGPHYFKGDNSPRWITADNPKGLWKDKVSNTSYMLHYAYSQLSDVEGKANRSCPKEYVDAALKGDVEKVQSCFVIDFDRDAFLAAAKGESEDFFFSRNVMTEGSRIRCSRNSKEGWCLVRDVEYFKALLLKTGLIQRVREPQQILRSHEKVVRMLMESDGHGQDALEEPHGIFDPIRLGIEAPLEAVQPT